jgi:hypothetical protein
MHLAHEFPKFFDETESSGVGGGIAEKDSGTRGL